MTDQQNGFEYDGTFYPWHVTTTGKDLLLIDRISGMAPQEFFELIEDNYDLSRAPVLLSLIATSIRNRHPERSLERIVRTVMDIDVEADDFTVIGGEADDEIPPAEAAKSGQSGTSSATSNGSAEATSRTSPATPPSSGSPGSPTGSPGSRVTA